MYLEANSKHLEASVTCVSLELYIYPDTAHYNKE